MITLAADPHPWAGALFHAWVELLTLLAMLLVALALIGFAWNRGFRPADRGPLITWPVLFLTYTLVLLLEHVRADLWPAIIIASGIVVAGFLSRAVYPLALWLPSVLIAALLGLGFNLSALLLTLIATFVLLFSTDRGR